MNLIKYSGRTSMQVTFIGLGVMGSPMAGHLANAGHQVKVFNRTHSKAQNWQNKYLGQACEILQDAVTDADIVFTCVGNDDDLRSICIGSRQHPGIFSSMKSKAIIVDHTTTSALIAKELYAAALKLSLHFIDAPVSGGQQGAENGKLTIMCGGDKQIFEKIKPVMTVYGHSIKHLGGSGNGQLTKMVNQICVVGLLQGLAEGMNFAESAGLDLQAVIDVISKGAAQSWQMDNRHKTMIAGEYDHGFAVDLVRKDLGICINEASINGSDLSATEQVDQYYKEIQELGGARWDTSSLFERLRSNKK